MKTAPGRVVRRKKAASKAPPGAEPSVTRIATRADLDALRESLAAARDPSRPCIAVCKGPGCLPSGGARVAEGWLYHFAEKLVAGESVKEVRRTSLATGAVEAIDAGLFRGNVFQWGRLRWLPGKRILLVGDGDRLAAVKIEE